MKKIILNICFVALLSYSGFSQKKDAVLEKYLNLVSKEELMTNVTTLASDEMEGRKTGELGQKKAAEYIRDFYKKLNISSAKGTEDYFQKVPSEAMRRAFSPKLNDSENVVAFIKGSEFPEEYIIISAHYDHVGMANGEIYNGADDNASGTSGVMEIARLFKKALDEGKGPKKSIIFLHCTGEEYGLHGSRYYVNNPLYPLENTICDLNVDMIGRTDEKHKNKKNYIYLVGSNKINQSLHNISEQTNADYIGLDLDYEFNAENHPEQIYYRSDHYNFAVRNIPVIFYYSGTHEDYHLPTDTADKIEFDKMVKRTQLVFATAWEIANTDKFQKIKK